MAKEKGTGSLPRVNLDMSGMESKLENLIQQNMAGFELVAGVTQDVLTTNRAMLANQEKWMQAQRDEHLAKMNADEEARRENARLLGGALAGAGAGAGLDGADELGKKLDKLTDTVKDGEGGGSLLGAVAGAMGITYVAGKGAGLLGKMKDALSLSSKTVGAGAEVADDVAKAAAQGSSKMAGAAKVLGKTNIALAIATNLKDAVDIGMAALDDDINTEVQKADVGGVVGGAIGGGIGFFLGGPAGAALGASLGNMIGEYVGEQFDADKIAAKVAEGITAQDQELKRKYEALGEQKKFLSAEEYARREALLDAEKALLQEQAEDYNNTKVLLEEEKKLAGDKYNEYAKFLESQAEMGIEMTAEQETQLAVLEEAFNQSSKRYADAVDQMKERLSQGELLDQAEDSGFYDKDWIGNSEIDRSKADQATAGQIKAILDDADINADDTKFLQDLLIKKMSQSKEEREALQNAHLEAKKTLDNTMIDEFGMDDNAGITYEVKPVTPPPVEPIKPGAENLEKAETPSNPSGEGAGGTVDGASRAVDAGNRVAVNSVNAPITNVDNSSSVVNQNSTTMVPPTASKPSNADWIRMAQDRRFG
jgi:hypothetical protein